MQRAALNKPLLLLALSMALVPSTARAERTLQLWMNGVAEWRVKPPWLVSFDVEPKVLLVGSGQWSNVDFTVSSAFSPTFWLGLLGELATGYTFDTINPDVAEVTPRVGLRVSPLRHRFEIRDTFRIESRNRFFRDGSKDNLFRTRNRIELSWVINREHITEPGAVQLLTDWEYFMPIERDVQERYASRHRLRGGVLYRVNVSWRVDLIYFWQMSRDTYGASFENRDHIIDVRVARRF